MTIHLHTLDPATEPGDLQLLNEGERRRAASFRFELDALHWIACRSRLRIILGKALSISPELVPLAVGSNGKPILDDPHGDTHFNVSHCPSRALIAWASVPVGVDLEHRDRGVDLLGCENSFCHPTELENLPSQNLARATVLLEIWTAKEALLKAHGSGLLVPPESFAINFMEEAAVPIFSSDLAPMRIFRLKSPALEDYCAFIASPTPAPLFIHH